MNINSTFSPVSPASMHVSQPQAPAAPPPELASSPLVTREQLDAAIERANDTLRRDNDSVRFAVHEGSNRIVVRIVDPKSMEIIREFPDTHFLDMMAKLQELSGMQVDVQT